MSIEHYPDNFVLNDDEDRSSPILDRSLSKIGPLDKSPRKDKNEARRISDKDLLISIQSPNFVDMRGFGGTNNEHQAFPAPSSCTGSQRIDLSTSTQQIEDQRILEGKFNDFYNRKIICSVFSLVFICNILINVDHGSLPGCHEQIKTKLDTDNFGFGVLGSIVYVGLIFGSLVASGLFSKGKWIKPTLIGSLIFTGFFYWCFTLPTNFLLMVFIRGAIGFFQIFLCIFIAVWIDTYGLEAEKTIWLSLNMLAAPLGVVIGYTLTYYMNVLHSWEWSFILQAICLVPCIACLVVTPSQYLNIEDAINFKRKCIDQIVQSKEDG